MQMQLRLKFETFAFWRIQPHVIQTFEKILMQCPIKIQAVSIKLNRQIECKFDSFMKFIRSPPGAVSKIDSA